MDLVVEEIRSEAAGVVSLDLVADDGSELPAWAPGAHIDVALGNGIERQFSLCGDPADTHRWRIAVLREPKSRGGSQYVHDELRKGHRVTIRGPRNNFPLVDADRYLFLAGGIGITPILTMLRAAIAHGADARLVYGGRHVASMAFADELAAYGDRVTLWPQDRRGLLPLDDLLSDLNGTKVYCCGPEPLLAAVEERCASVHLERFRPRPGALDGAATAFEVVAEFSGVTVQVAADESIATALEAAGVYVDTSCREGTCGTCETAVLEGVPDHRDSFLTAAERESNETMMVCCSRAHGDRLVLDL